jgi:hypothetical protein
MTMEKDEFSSLLLNKGDLRGELAKALEGDELAKALEGEGGVGGGEAAPAADPAAAVGAEREGGGTLDAAAKDKDAEAENVILPDAAPGVEVHPIPAPSSSSSSSSNNSGAGASADFEPAMFFKVGEMLFRAQLDAFDPKLKGKRKVFDLKTRATLPIRMDVANYQKYIGYKVVQDKGILHSYEREIFDMARSAFLKYSLQCRIGLMHGIMVAYHNTKEVSAVWVGRV